jgi:hypothetical protein
MRSGTRTWIHQRKSSSGSSRTGNVRVEVTDPGPLFAPELRRLDPGPSGWGLFLVDTIAASWGVEAEGTGKKVWFELG